MVMNCCKIGCNKEPIRKQRICFINESGYMIHCYIQWCADHQPADIMIENEIEIVNDRGASY